MRRIPSRRGFRLLVVASVVLAAAAGTSFATAHLARVATGSTIQACANTTNGLLRLVGAPGDCRETEQPVSWPAQSGGGGALAVAVIAADGTLNAARSRGVTSVALVTGPPFLGTNLRTLCVQLDPSVRAAVNVMNVQSVGINPFVGSADVLATLAADASPVLVAATGCPSSTDAFVSVGSVQSGTRSGPYYIAFN